MSVTGNLDGTSAYSEATGCYDISLSKNCSELIFAVREAMVVFNLVISSIKLAVRTVRKVITSIGSGKAVDWLFQFIVTTRKVYEESMK